MLRKLKRVEKAWGCELWISNTALYCGKILTVLPGRRCGVHCHERKTETFYVLAGRALMMLESEEHVVEAGSVVDIQPYTWHGFKAESDTPLVIMEVSTQHFEFDTKRLKPEEEPTHAVNF